MANRRFFQGTYFDNLGCALSGGTFTIQDALGRALSTDNPAYIVLPSQATPGQFTEYRVTANQAFIDDAGSSEIIDNLFGFVTSIAVTEIVPFYIYAVPNDAETSIQFMISRVPGVETSPAAASIGAPDDAVADTQQSFWSLDNIDETLFDANPCLMIGSFRMVMSSSDDWTVQTIDDQDGTGKYQEERSFGMQAGQFGATTATFMLPNGGTVPIFSTQNYLYRVQKNGYVNSQFSLSGDGGTDGADAVSTLLTIPFIPDNSSVSANQTIGHGRNSDPTNGDTTALFQNTTDSN